MFYYVNAKGEKFEIAFNCRGGVESLYLKGTETMMDSQQVAETVFGPDEAKPGELETWEDMGDLAMERVFSAYDEQLKQHTADFEAAYPGAEVIKKPFDFEGDLTVIFRRSGSGELGVSFLNDDAVWQDCPMTKHILEVFKM